MVIIKIALLIFIDDHLFEILPAKAPNIDTIEYPGKIATMYINPRSRDIRNSSGQAIGILHKLA